MFLARFRWLLVPVLLLAVAPRVLANSAEERAFDAAARQLADAFYPQAEAGFADFTAKFPTSSRLAEAYLYQAEARLKQDNLDGAIQLLAEHQAQAGRWADQYIFWTGQACLQKAEAESDKEELRVKDYQTARDLFAKLLEQFPGSRRNLEAEVSEATACSKLGDWARVTTLLQRANGVFQSAVATNLINDWTLHGYLLRSEALLMQKDYSGAELALQTMGKLQLNPFLDWQWQYLSNRIALAAGHPEIALAGTTNLIEKAVKTGDSKLKAESAVFQARLFEQLGQFDNAIASYNLNVTAGTPPERQREALWRITQLCVANNEIKNATDKLNEFLTKYPQAAAADLAWLRMGELGLLQFAMANGTNTLPTVSSNAPAATNTLLQAIFALRSLLDQFPQSTNTPKAHLDLGWCYWLQRNWKDSAASFQAACQSLPPSPEQAVAYYKLADAQFQETNLTAAIANYGTLLEKFKGQPEVETNFFEAALYQTVRAALARGDLVTAGDALRKLLDWYPTSYYADKAVLFTGQTIGQSEPAKARELYLSFARQATNAALLPEIGLAVARTYEQENDWAAALNHYDLWLTNFPSSNLRPRAEFQRARAFSQAGQQGKALEGFTSLIARFPTNEFAPLAQWCVANHYYLTADYPVAQTNFENLFLNTNWHRSDLSYQAKMMAGRSSIAHFGWADAERYFTNLTMDISCPPELWVRAMFAYGDLYRSRDSTNKMADYDTAIQIFGSICERYPSNREALLAKAETQFTYAQFTHQYEEAITNFLKVIEADSPRADISFRSQASYGLANALIKQAQTGVENADHLLELAIGRYTDVLYDKILRDGETRDEQCAKRCGLEAAALLETQKKWDQAIRLYENMKEMFPPLRAMLDKKIAQDEQKSRGAEEPKLVSAGNSDSADQAKAPRSTKSP